MTGLPTKPAVPVDAALLADFAQAAYWPRSDAEAFLARIDFDLERWIARRDTECFVAVNHEHRRAVFAFRGTQPGRLRDWLTDLNARQTAWASGRVHAGFQESVDQVFADLYPILAELSAHGMALYGTGHSKGAAEATLTAARLRAAQHPVAGLCTFGSPRVGDTRFAAWMDAVMPFAIHRYVNNNDLVARLPLPAAWISRYVPLGWLWPVGFRHCGRLHYVTAGGEILDDPPISKLCRDRLTGRWLSGRDWWNDGIRDHALWRYREALA